jgi:hypothetical protein
MLRHGRRFAALSFAVSLVVASRSAPAESACDVSVLGTVAVEQDGLEVVETKLANLQRNDVVLQLNSHRLRRCEDLQRALDEAQRNGLELIVLVRRGDARRTEWIRDWREVAKIAPVGLAPSLTPAPRTTAPAPTPAAPVLAPADATAARVDLSRRLAFARELRGSLPVTSAGRWVREIDELLVARSTPATLDGLNRIDSYYATIAEVLTYREKATRNLGAGRNRAGLTLEYDNRSPVNGWLDRYPFLSGSVSRPFDPSRSFMSGQRMGLWSPDEAVRLLVERAVSDGEQLEAALPAAASP